MLSAEGTGRWIGGGWHGQHLDEFTYLLLIHATYDANCRYFIPCELLPTPAAGRLGASSWVRCSTSAVAIAISATSPITQPVKAVIGRGDGRAIEARTYA